MLIGLEALAADDRIAPGALQVEFHHLFNEGIEADLRLPSELGARPCGVAQQGVNFSGPEITGVDPNNHLAGACIDALFIQTLALPLQLYVEVSRSSNHKLPDGML